MILLIGYGNPGRGDDGLGPVLAERIEERNLPGLDVKIDFQLKVEHALAIAEADIVVFADAQMNRPPPFTFREVRPRAGGEIGSHSLSPESVLSLATLLFGATARGFELGISGIDYAEVKEGLGDFASQNLDQAEQHLLKWLSDHETHVPLRNLATVPR